MCCLPNPYYLNQTEDIFNKTMSSISYFSGGPAKIPNEVLSQVSKDVLSYGNSGVGVLEISHRSQAYLDILENAIKDVKTVLNVPDNYCILFIPGGGTGQFAAVPLNLISKKGKADYIVTGTWSKQAAEEASKFGTVQRVLEADCLTGVPDKSTWKLDPEASYLYYCDNETIQGVEFASIPEAPPGVPLVCDMSSNICTRTFDVSKFGLIYAGAQKNIGAAGVTLVIIREDLLDYPKLSTCPIILDYANVAKKNSNYNTPPIYAIHVLGQTVNWVLRQGSLKAMTEKNATKSSILYQTIADSSGFYRNGVQENSRSRVNVVFNIFTIDSRNADLESKFIKEADQKNLKSLKGHRSVGGMRASLFNAISMDDVEALVDFMKAFQTANS